MKFKSQVLTQASGSIGGVTYSHNRGGMYQRARAIPTNPNSLQQQGVRNSFSTLSQQWGGQLTQTQRDAWTAYAVTTPVTDRLGDPLTLTGQQMFIRCNSLRALAGLTAVLDGPTTSGLAEFGPSSMDADLVSGSLSFVYTASGIWVSQNGAGLVVQTSHFRGPAINFLRSPFRLQEVIIGSAVTPPDEPFDLGPNNAFDEVLDNQAIGRRLFWRASVYLADGRISAPQTGYAVVA